MIKHTKEKIDAANAVVKLSDHIVEEFNIYEGDEFHSANYQNALFTLMNTVITMISWEEKEENVMKVARDYFLFAADICERKNDTKPIKLSDIR